MRKASTTSTKQAPGGEHAADSTNNHTKLPSNNNSNPFAASADVFRQYQKSGGTTTMTFGANKEKDEPSSTTSHQQQAQELAKQMDEFVKQQQQDDEKQETDADTQLQSARKLRQLLPTNKELLHLAQERNWIPLLLGWLNLHDRPAVQVEALLALTNIAELAAQQQYYGNTTTSSSSSAAAAAALKASSKFGDPSPFFDTNNNGGSVPFPPLSFSQTLSPEAVDAFEKNLSSSIQKTKSGKSTTNSSTKNSSSSFPSSSSSSSAVSSAFPTLPSSLFASALLRDAATSSSSSSGGSGGTGSSPFSTSNSLIPPPTPVDSGNGIGGGSFPQQLSASSQHLLLRHADAIPTLIELLNSPQKEVYEQSMWILGSIAAGDSTTTGSSDKQIPARDVVLAAGIMTPLLDCLEAHTTNLSLQRMGSWTLSNLVEGIFQQSSSSKSSSRNLDYVSSDDIDVVELLPVLRRLLNTADSEVLSYTCWTLSHLCDGPSSHIAAIVTTKDKKKPFGGLVPRLVELLVHPSWRVTKPALRTIGNIVCAECSDEDKNSSTSTSTTDYTEIILDCGAVPRLKELVTHNNREIQKEACWTLSNIAAGTVDQIQAVLDSGAIPPLVKLVSDKKTDQEVRSEACWVVLNATSCGSNAQIEELVEEGCVEVLGVLLGEQSMVMMALEGLERVLQVEEIREEERRLMIDLSPSRTLVSASLFEKALDTHNSSAVTKRANRIWKQHFVSCALCNESFSKHRTADATFCEECKCYVCSKCDCRVYHLSYQEELWAEDEQKPEAKKSKSKKKKKKKKGVNQQPLVPTDDHQPTLTKEGSTARSRGSSDGSESNKNTPEKKLNSESGHSKKSGANDDPSQLGDSYEDVTGSGPAGEEESPQDGEQIDFVLYLQETGSIIALAKLMDAMDALDYGDENGYDDAEFDTRELEMLQQHKMALNQQQATN